MAFNKPVNVPTVKYQMALTFEGFLGTRRRSTNVQKTLLAVLSLSIALGDITEDEHQENAGMHPSELRGALSSWPTQRAAAGASEVLDEEVELSDPQNDLVPQRAEALAADPPLSDRQPSVTPLGRWLKVLSDLFASFTRGKIQSHTTSEMPRYSNTEDTWLASDFKAPDAPPAPSQPELPRPAPVETVTPDDSFNSTTPSTRLRIAPAPSPAPPPPADSTKPQKFCEAGIPRPPPSKSGSKKLSKPKRFCTPALDPSALNQQYVRPYFNRHRGQTGILMGTGPSLEKFHYVTKDPADRRVVIFGTNGAIHWRRKVDYLFVHHGFGEDPNVKRQLMQYHPRKQKFFGHFPCCPKAGFSAADVMLSPNTSQFQVQSFICDRQPFPLVADVGRYPFGGSCSVIFSALQFALYTGIHNLFIVGCDTSENGYTKSGNLEHKNRNLSGVGKILKMWKEAVAWMKKAYPHVNIHVVNALGLKGLGLKEVSHVVWTRDHIQKAKSVAAAMRHKTNRTSMVQ
ncbi:hypothetical protein CYMTET_56947 [Cymbomonas tetramitiformis]|uniref:Uncharacterized protein n=1 Tax=Cymbomonas tetramitiformis TaxID=36881 RepID=A0AAE0B9V5_9CHLO|nr:hypothetical protein CYMTET_56947 [Cymbomonas tetramitiformis]